MRQIKFRGKRIDNGEWVYGNLIRMESSHKYGNNSKFSNCWIMEMDDLDVDCFVGKGVRVGNQLIQVDPETVGQYTGLQDSKGKEIYEEDLLQDENGIGEVEWVQEHCAFLVFTRNPSQYHKIESDGVLKNTEIIGNIYEHPHLLEVESNGITTKDDRQR